uniref:Uncharacterized protein n=1 Tax=Anguilla anguilla TaxID=7936 RepID=A0A0E9XMR7_ANGAN
MEGMLAVWSPALAESFLIPDITGDETTLLLLLKSHWKTVV